MQPAEHMEDRYVYLHANLKQQGQLIVERIEPRIYQITGRISAQNGSRLRVGDVWLQIDNDTQQPDVIELGQTVRVSMTRLQGEVLIALKIEGIDQAPLPSQVIHTVSRSSETPVPNKSEDYNLSSTPPEKTVEPMKTEQTDAQEEPYPEKTESSDRVGRG